MFKARRLRKLKERKAELEARIHAREAHMNRCKEYSSLWPDEVVQMRGELAIVNVKIAALENENE